MTGQGKQAIDLALAESFKELASRHPIEKITIKDITDKAGVIRPTFYNHFQDKYELIEWIVMEQIIRPAAPLIENGMFNEAVVLMFTSLEKDKPFYMNAVKLEGQNSLQSIAEDCVRQILLAIMEKKGTKKDKAHPWITYERVAQFYAQSMCYIVIEWIKSGMNIPPREIAAAYEYMMTKQMTDFF